ncbi:hypothetical protein M3Y94_01058300 [Aphelenchoides besseyi]|nr:hypothetical protein M3Y94_01058300 [Aphelenchoides besseyi]KAI6224157.1 hypothetical protein M3Y95_00853400 [Aphelenchoides besseyi]
MLAFRTFIRRASNITALSYQARPSNPKTGRALLVENWKAPNCDFVVNVEIARPDDFELVRGFMLNESRTQEAVISTQNSSKNEIDLFLTQMAHRSTVTPTTALMFKDTELIGMVAGSVNELPKKREKEEFHLPPDMKELIDKAEGNSRKEKRIYALCALFFQIIPSHIELEHKYYICGELSGIVRKYQNRKLLLPVTQLLAEYYAKSGFSYIDTICTSAAMRHVVSLLGLEPLHEVRYDQFLDDGERCFGEPEDGGEICTLMLGNFNKMGFTVAKPYK